MKQEEVSKWLKAITVILGGMGLLFFFFIIPALAGYLTELYPKEAAMYWPAILYGGVIAVFCYAILFQFWKVCSEIGRDNSFSMENARAFVTISRFSLVMAGVWFAGMLFLVCKAYFNPGVLIFFVMAVLLSMIVSILAAALSHLILKAYELRQENDLTI